MSWYKNAQTWFSSPQEVRDDESGGVYKFVKVNGQYRFIYNENNHSSAVQEGEVAEAAGTIAEFESYWKFYQTYSTTLKVSIQPETEDELTQIIGKPYKDLWA